MTTAPVSVRLPELYDPATGRLDAERIARYLSVPLSKLAVVLGRKYSTLHKTPAAPAVQPALASLKHTLDMLDEVLGDRAVILAWLNSPHPDLGGRTPWEAFQQGYGDAVEHMLQNALWGIPS